METEDRSRQRGRATELATVVAAVLSTGVAVAALWIALATVKATDRANANTYYATQNQTVAQMCQQWATWVRDEQTKVSNQGVDAATLDRQLDRIGQVWAGRVGENWRLVAIQNGETITSAQLPLARTCGSAAEFRAAAK